MYCTEIHNFWTILYVLLGITYVFVLSGLIMSLQNGLIFYIFFLSIASAIYLMQAFYFKKFYEAYEKAFGIGIAINRPE